MKQKLFQAVCQLLIGHRIIITESRCSSNAHMGRCTAINESEEGGINIRLDDGSSYGMIVSSCDDAECKGVIARGSDNFRKVRRVSFDTVQWRQKDGRMYCSPLYHGIRESTAIAVAGYACGKEALRLQHASDDGSVGSDSLDVSFIELIHGVRFTVAISAGFPQVAPDHPLEIVYSCGDASIEACHLAQRG